MLESRSLSQRLEIVLQGVADGITVQDKTGRLVLANAAAARICGFSSAEELVNTPPAEIVGHFEMLDEEGRPLSVDRLPGRRVLAGEREASLVIRVRSRRTGQEWWSQVRAAPIRGVDGKPELAVNIWHDVSDDRRQKRQAKFLDAATTALGASLRQDEMLSTLANVVVPELADWCAIALLEKDELRNVAIAHVDPDRIEIAREYQAKYPPDREQSGVWTVARTGESLLYDEITDEMLAGAARDAEHLEILKAIGIRSALLVPIRLRNQVLGVISLVSAESGSRYDEHHVALAEELGRRAAVALENACLYRDAQEAATSARAANRAKDEFLAIVSHELRTPLNAILGWATLLKDRVTDPNIGKPLSVIHRNAQKQVQLIDDLMDVSRIITGNLRLEEKPTDLVHVAREAIEVVRQSAVAKQVGLEFTPMGEFVLLVADPERMQQVVWNLLTNAVKFTDSGGEIRLSVWQEGANAYLTVRDTGKGIDPEFLPFVFDRFKQADTSMTRRTGGLGLGLALVRNIVELHGGKVTASSEGIGKGSVFTITLPIRAVAPRQGESSRPPPKLETARESRTLAGVKVLVVDDEHDAVELISAALSEAGASVEVARSAAAGFESVKRGRPDVLVSDIGMPDQDGYAFMRRVRGLSHLDGGATPSLALTAFAGEEERRRAIASGYTTHLRKPVDPAELISAVASLAIVTRKR